MSNPSLAMGRTVEPHDVFHLFVVKTSDREQTRTAFDEIGITTDVHYPVPDYQQPRFSPYASESVTLEATDAHCRNVLTIPCYPSMEQQQVDRVCEALRIGWL
jgi:dTDP-4-amino-4,6-dideoxygalactose transaminase